MILLVREGRRDHGDAEPFGDPDHEGPLRPLLSALLGHPEGLVVHSRSLGKLHGRPPKRGIAPSQRGLTTKVQRVLNDLNRDGFAGAVIVIDEDGRDPAARRDRLNRLDAGRQGSAAPCALGVARPMVEAWLLGDPDAWPKAFAGRVPEPF